MQFHWPLFLWMVRPLFWLSVASSAVAFGYIMLHAEPLDVRRDQTALLFIIVHSFLISRLIGRVRSGSFAYLYSQGFSRDVLWNHLWLASMASVLATLLPCALLILTPLRSLYQESQQNPWFPLMASTEWPSLVTALALYAVVLPVFHYEWIRSSMSFAGLVSGHMLALACLVVAFMLGDRLTGFRPDSGRDWMLGGFALISVILAITGRWLHRRMEICA